MKTLTPLLTVALFLLAIAGNVMAQDDIAIENVFMSHYLPDGEHPVTVVVYNANSGNIHDLTLEWSLNDGEQTGSETLEVTNVNNLYITAVTSTELFMVSDDEDDYELEIWVSEPDGNEDPDPSNGYASFNFTRLPNACEKKVLVEPHLGTDSSFGPQIEIHAQEIQDNYPDNVLVAGLHTVDALTMEDIVYDILYEDGFDMGYADGMIDRTYFPKQSSYEVNAEMADWNELVGERVNSNVFYAPVRLETSNTYDDDSRELTVDIDATFLTDMTGDYHFNCYIIEDPVEGVQINRYSSESSGSDNPDHPFYDEPATIYDFQHRNVCREMLGGPWGTADEISSNIDMDDEFSIQYNYTIPEEFDDENISLIVLVQKYNEDDIEDRMILNALDCQLNDSNEHAWLGSTPPPVADFLFGGKLFLEGAYDEDGEMTTILEDEYLTPEDQPFDVAPYNYNGTESSDNVPNEVVDWILIEARTGTPNISGDKGTETVEVHAAFLTDDGEIWGVDEDQGVVFSNLVPGEEYYFCIRHRNHLDVLTAESIEAEANMYYDFSTDVDQAFGNQQMKWSDDGRAMLYVGDFNQDGVIQTTDYDAWAEEPAINNTYSTTDANLDGVVQVTDFDAWFPNKAKVGTPEINY